MVADQQQTAEELVEILHAVAGAEFQDEALLHRMRTLNMKLGPTYTAMYGRIPLISTDYPPRIWWPRALEQAQQALAAIEAGVLEAQRSVVSVGAQDDKPASSLLSLQSIFMKGQPYDALRAVTAPFRDATTSITLIDGYIDATVLDLLTEKRAGVAVRILTKPPKPAVEALALTFSRQYGPLAIRTSETFHDRFLVVDDVVYMHLGASLKDVGKKTFMLSIIDAPSEVEKLRSHIEEEWRSGAVTQIR
jgi:hypothetical protein